jgi:hypothetical protein
MSSSIVLDKNYAELNLSTGRLHHFREEMFKIAKQWGIDDKSTVVNFLSHFYGSTYIDIVDELIEKSEIELFGKLFLAAVEKSDSEGYFDYFEIPDDTELRSFYYQMMRICFEPTDCDCCIAKVNSKMFIEKTGGIFKEGTNSQRYYEFANKILEYAAKLED